MFHRVTAISTLASMLLHAVLGCCCHDACAAGTCAEAVHETRDADDQRESTCPCRAHAEKRKAAASLIAAEESDEHQHQHGLCEEARCRFVRSADSSAQWLLLQSSLAMLPLETTALPLPGERLRTGERHITPIDTSPPARLRAQIWLL